jgi:hypothetical protein
LRQYVQVFDFFSGHISKSAERGTQNIFDNHFSARMKSHGGKHALSDLTASLAF